MQSGGALSRSVENCRVAVELSCRSSSCRVSCQVAPVEFPVELSRVEARAQNSFSHQVRVEQRKTCAQHGLAHHGLYSKSVLSPGVEPTCMVLKITRPCSPRWEILTKTVNRYTEIHSVSDSQADTHHIHTQIRAVPSSRYGLLDTAFLKTFFAERDAALNPMEPEP